MFGKKSKEDKWFETAYFMYRKHKLPAPYENLFYYYYNTSWSAPKKGNRMGHFEIFSGAKFNEFLNDLTRDMYSILPQDLFDNYSKALEKFNALGEDPEYEEVENTFDEYDDYADECSEKIENILRNYVLRLE